MKFSELKAGEKFVFEWDLPGWPGREEGPEPEKAELLVKLKKPVVRKVKMDDEGRKFEVMVGHQARYVTSGKLAMVNDTRQNYGVVKII